MDPALSLRLRKIQNFGRFARAACTAAAVIVVASALITGLVFSRGSAMTFDFGSLSFPGEAASPALRTWLMLIMLANTGLFFQGLRLLWRIFDHLAKGEIYTVGPVRALRSLGRLMLLAASLQVLVPLITLVLWQASAFGSPETVHFNLNLSFGLLTGFAAAGVVLLLSWILDVGLSLREERDALRQDAELVV